MDQETIWRGLRTLAQAGGNPNDGRSASALATAAANLDTPERRLVDLYLPLCHGCPARFVVAHLGQSLDGRIAVANGRSRWITGREDIVHNHRMRALFDAVVVGAGTVRHDDPQLTVRAVAGDHPVRVVVDTRRRLSADHRVFRDGAASTLLLCAADLTRPGDHQGLAEVIGIAPQGDGLCYQAILDALAARGLRRVFVEGGGVTVSRFLAAGCLDRLQITVAPIIIGSGRPSITLPEINAPCEGMRPPVRSFPMGEDVLFECRFEGSRETRRHPGASPDWSGGQPRR